MKSPACVFVICLTPSRLLTPWRRYARTLMFRSLAGQTCDDWAVVCVGCLGGEELAQLHAAGVLRHVYELDPDDGTKAEKQPVGWDFAKWLRRSGWTGARLVCKLDDDDWLHPTALERALDAGADVYADRTNWHLDVCTGRWLPYDKGPVMLANTVFHAFEHAQTTHGDSELFLRTHSAWGPYYADKEKAYAPPEEPVYARVVHPHSTSVAGAGLKEPTLTRHRAYCRMKAERCGQPWQAAGPPAFEAYAQAAHREWEHRQIVIT